LPALVLRVRIPPLLCIPTLDRCSRTLLGSKEAVTPPAKQLAVEERGRELYEAAQRLDLEGIVATRKADPYGPTTVWYKIKNPAYTQAEGRGDLFERKRK
jgi:hypothetical protein